MAAGARGPVGAGTRPQPHSAPCPAALLYLFALHDHDRSGRLDGLELLQLLGAVLVQRDGERLDPDVVGPTGMAPRTPWSTPGPGPHPVPTLSPQVAALVDRALERQDLSRDGLLDPPELLLSPGRGQGPPGQPLQQPGELLAGAGAAPRGDTEVPEGDTGVSILTEGQGLPGGSAHPEGQAAPQAEAMEVEETPEAEGLNTEAIKAEEAPEIEAPEAGDPEGEVAPAWGDPGEG